MTDQLDLLGDNDADPAPAPYIDAPPVHPNQENLWRQRAAEYNSAYAGPIHWRRAINVLAATGSLPLALREANISRLAFNQRRERYPEFAEAIGEAQDFFRHRVIEHTAVIRAVDGYLEPVYHKGVKVGLVRKFSDTLLVKLMEGNLSEKYRNKTDVNVNGKVQVVGGLPSRPLTEADVPPHVRTALTIEHEPAPVVAQLDAPEK